MAWSRSKIPLVHKKDGCVSLPSRRFYASLLPSTRGPDQQQHEEVLVLHSASSATSTLMLVPSYQSMIVLVFFKASGNVVLLGSLLAIQTTCLSIFHGASGYGPFGF